MENNQLPKKGKKYKCNDHIMSDNSWLEYQGAKIQHNLVLCIFQRIWFDDLYGELYTHSLASFHETFVELSEPCFNKPKGDK